MFLLDDILMAPFKGLAGICRKVYEAAEDDLEGQEKSLLATLAELYQELETGNIGDEDFNTRENALLERLEAVRDARSGHHGAA
jgi:hypothetical protein